MYPSASRTILIRTNHYPLPLRLRGRTETGLLWGPLLFCSGKHQKRLKNWDLTCGIHSSSASFFHLSHADIFIYCCVCFSFSPASLCSCWLCVFLFFPQKSHFLLVPVCNSHRKMHITTLYPIKKIMFFVICNHNFFICKSFKCLVCSIHFVWLTRQFFFSYLR